ncbi:DUF859 family phage minor structural protein [uncultured Trichococcus sp.]|uniref:DUF859 family phage minor structural protein n=1 Tax=uncultured Trichococcus sp. TaxID=189665 RepID=UPI002A1886AE|nr:DUF859 family phage minor structural protein [uncultured Trichococcus sp.]
MALSGSNTQNVPYTSGNLAIRIDWTASQNVAGNYSDVNVRVYIVRGTYGYNTNSTSDATTLWIAGQEYSTTSSVGGSSNTESLLMERTKRIYHNADGTKSFSIDFRKYFGLSWSGTWIGTVNFDAVTYWLDTIPRASTITTKNATTLETITAADYGETIRLSINRPSTSFTSTVYAVWNGQVVGIAERIDYEQHNWTIPLWLMDYIPNAANSWGAIYCETYSGDTLIGTTETWLNAIVPPDVIPVIDTATVVEAVAGLAAKFGAYVQSKSKLAIAMTASGVYSSTISAYKITANGASYNAASATTSELLDSGSQDVVFEVTDSRGRKASHRVTITVLAYTPPSVLSIAASRVDPDGTPNEEEGIHAKVVFKATATTLNNLNDKLLEINMKQVGTETWTTAYSDAAAFTYDTFQVVAGFNGDYAYDIQVKMSDYFGSAVLSTTLSTAFTLVDYFAGGKGIAFGKVAEKVGMEIALDADFTKAPTIIAPVSDVADGAFMRLRRFDETLLAFIGTGAGGTGLNIHLYDGVSWSGMVSIGENGDIYTSGKLKTDGFIEAGGFTSKEILASTDLNNYVNPGLYHCLTNANAATISNVPAAAAFSLFVEKHAGIKQTFTRYEPGIPVTYIRNYYDGTWGAWYQVAFV